jgi:hypothetical protein
MSDNVDHRDEMQILLKLMALGDAMAAVDLSRRIQSLRTQLSTAEERDAEHQKTFERHAEIIGKQDRQIVAAEAQCAAMAVALKPFSDANFECDAADDESVELFWGEDESWHIATITMGNLRRARDALALLLPLPQKDTDG